jgi:hypothetical protein
MNIVESLWQFLASYPLWARVLAGSGLAVTFFTLLLVERRPGSPQPSAPSTVPAPAAGGRVVFDGRGNVDGFAVAGRPGTLWTGSWPKPKPIGNKGEGSLRFEPGGVLNVQRTNTDGRFELVLRRYVYGGQEFDVLPSDDVIAGNRQLHISCQAKAVGGEHTLRFVVNAKSGQQLASYVQKVTANRWIPVNAYLEAPPTEDAEVRIYDEQVTAPGSVQIKDLVVTQRPR